MRGLALTYIQSARRPGRTTPLVESGKGGDRIVFADSREAERVRRLCKERGVTVECLVRKTKTPERLFERGTSNGRTIFDHSWVERYYLDNLERCANDIDHLEQQLSGCGEAHRETKRRAEELVKWQV